MKILRKYLDVPTEYREKIRAKLIVDISGTKYMCSLELNIPHPEQSNVITSLFKVGDGWRAVLHELGSENLLAWDFARLERSAQGDALRTGMLTQRIEEEMIRQCKLAAEINS